MVVDSGSFYMTDRYTFPVVLDNVTEGWCWDKVMLWVRVMLCVCVCVGGVTVVVDSGSFYMTDCYTFPVVLDNLTEGWCWD